MGSRATFKFLVLMLISSFFTSSCISSKYKLTRDFKRIKSTEINPPNPEKYFEIISTARIPANSKKNESSKTVFDLSDRGQKQLIIQYSKFDTSSTQLHLNLNRSFKATKEKAKKKRIDDSMLLLKRQISFFVNNILRDTKPSSRIMVLQLEVQLVDTVRDKVRFSSISEFQTQYEFVDFGTVTQTGTTNFSLNAGINSTNIFSDTNSSDNSSITRSSSIEPTISTSYGSTNSLSEARNFKRRSIKQTGFVTDDYIQIYMEGTDQRDLNGPIVLNIELLGIEGKMKTKNFEYIDYEVKGKKILIQPRTNVIPYNAEIPVNLTANLLIREVVKKGRTIPEGDDVIILKRFSDVDLGQINLVKKDEVKVYYTQIEILKGSSQEPIYLLDKIKKQKFLVRFLSKDRARIFLDYLLQIRSNDLGDFLVVDFNEKPIDVSEFKNFGLFWDEMQ